MKWLKPLLAIALIFLPLYSNGAEHGHLPRTLVGDVGPILERYQQLSGLELVLDPKVEAMHCIVSVAELAGRSRPEQLRLLEKALSEQAGIIIVKLPGNQALVTHGAERDIIRVRRNSHDSQDWLDAPRELKGVIDVACLDAPSAGRLQDSHAPFA